LPLDRAAEDRPSAAPGGARQADRQWLNESDCCLAEPGVWTEFNGKCAERIFREAGFDAA
jgi:hypothetical protein